MPTSNGASTQQILEITEIKDDVVHLKAGSVRAVVMVSGLNFDLKSEEEQNLILFAYQSFLNSLDFSLQFVVHSRKLNIDGYLEMLRDREVKETHELLKNQISEYREFVKSFVNLNAIMSKTFYVVVPYDSEGAGAAAVTSGLGSLFGGGKKPAPQVGAQSQDISSSIAQLDRRTERVTSGLQRVGVRAVRLNTDELIELYYNIYNPEEKEKSISITKGFAA